MRTKVLIAVLLALMLLVSCATTGDGEVSKKTECTAGNKHGFLCHKYTSNIISINCHSNYKLNINKLQEVFIKYLLTFYI